MIACEAGPPSCFRGEDPCRQSLGPNCRLAYCVLQSQCTEGPSRLQDGQAAGYSVRRLTGTASALELISRCRD